MRLVDLARTGRRTPLILLWSPRVFFGVVLPMGLLASLMAGYGIFYLGPKPEWLSVGLCLLGGYALEAWRRCTLYMSCCLPFVIDSLGEGEEDPEKRVRSLRQFRDWLFANNLVGPHVSRWIWDRHSRNCFEFTRRQLDRLLEHAESTPLTGPWADIDDYLPIEERIRVLGIQTRLAIPALVHEEIGRSNCFIYATLLAGPMFLGMDLHHPAVADYLDQTLEQLRWW